MNRSVITLATMLTCFLLLAGCAADGQGRKPNPRDPAPDSEPPVQMQITLGLPSDSDGNGYPDTMQAVVYLFPDSRVSVLPVRTEGSFEFVMQTTAGDVAAQWVFDPQRVREATRMLPAGPGYSMFLRLTPGADVMQPTNMEIRCRFLSSDGRQIRGMGGTVRLGG